MAPLELVARPAQHRRQPREGRDAPVAERGVVLAHRLEHDRPAGRVVVEPVDRGDVAGRAVAQPAEAVEAWASARSRPCARRCPPPDTRRAGQRDRGDGADEQARRAARQPRPPPGERADAGEPEQEPGLVVELEDRVHAEQRAAVELVAHIEHLGPEQAGDARRQQHPHRPQPGRHGRRHDRRERDDEQHAEQRDVREVHRGEQRAGEHGGDPDPDRVAAAAAASPPAGRGRRGRRTRRASRRAAAGRGASPRSRGPPPPSRSRARPGRRRGGRAARAAR